MDDGHQSEIKTTLLQTKGESQQIQNTATIST